jgi:hypothetical protein
MTTSQKMEDDPKKNQNGRRPQTKSKWKTISFFIFCWKTSMTTSEKNGWRPQKINKMQCKMTSEKMEEDLNRKCNGGRPQKKKEENLKDGRRPKKNGRRPQLQFKKSILIGCDIIVN